MRFDLPDLGLFLAVAEAGSITHGARAANLSLAAASERLRDMEEAAGVALLIRDRRGVRLTRPGETLVHHARRVLREMASLRTELSHHAAGFRGCVRLLANSAASAGALPDRLGSFLARHPGADIDLSERPSPEIVKAVAAGLGEIGIVSDAADTGALRTRLFALDRLLLVMPRAHPLAGQRSVALADLSGEPVIACRGALQLHLADQAERLGFRLRPRVTLASFEAVCRVAAEGAGVGIVPEAALRRAGRSPRLATALLSDPFATRRLLLCSAAPERLDTLPRALLDHLAADEAGRWPAPAALPGDG